MPIHGLSNQRRITRAGYIRLGEKKTNAKGVEYPAKVDHFIPDFEDPAMNATFARVYGPAPKAITVAMPSNDPEIVFPQWYKLYGSSGLKCRGDGQTAYQRDEAGEINEVECPTPADCEFCRNEKGLPECKPIGSLQVFVKGLPTLSVAQINTSSRNSIINLNSGLEQLAMLCSTKPHGMAGVWVTLRLVEQQAQVSGKGVTIYVMQIDPGVGLEDIQRLESAYTPSVALPPPSEERDPLLHPVNGFAPEPEAEPMIPPVASPAKPAGLADDPEVKVAFDSAHTSPAKRASLLQAATTNKWTREQLCEMIINGRLNTTPSGDAGEVRF
jgi:hypothetical protein